MVRDRYKKRLITQVLVPAILAIGLLITTFFITISYTKQILVNTKKQHVKEIVNSVYSIIENYQVKVDQGELTKEEAQAFIRDIALNARYGADNKNYYWIIDYESKQIAHHYYNDSLRVAFTDPSYGKTLTTIISKAKEFGGAFYTYPMQWKGDASRIEMKTAYLRNVESWEWVMGSGFYEIEVNTEIKKLTSFLILIFTVLAILVLVLLLVILRKGVNDLNLIVNNENNIERAEDRFRNMADHVNSGLQILKNEKLVYSNSMFAYILDEPYPLVKSVSAFDYGAKEEKERIRKVSAELKESNESKEVQFWISTKKGVRKYIIIRISHEFQGNDKYTYLLISDITERIELEVKLKGLSQTIAQAPDLIVIADLNWNIVYANNAFCERLGYSEAELIGKSAAIITADNTPPSVLVDLRTTVSAGKIWKKEVLTKKKDGNHFPELSLVFPIFDDNQEIILFASVKKDLTFQKQIEQELSYAKERAELSEKITNSFLQNVSHEVNTPLNAIYGFTSLLIEDKNLDKEQVELLGIVHQNADVLLKLFRDIIDYTAIESGNINFNRSEINLYELMLELAETTNTKLKQQGKADRLKVKLMVQPNFDKAILVSDKFWVLRVMNEFLSNAIKFTDVGLITLGYSIDYDNVMFYVHDTGVGIPEKEKSRIFEKFTHGSKLYVSLHKGTGLGLSISKLIVNCMGGNIWFKTVENKGSAFYFSLSSLDVKNYKIDNIIQNDFPYKNLLSKDKIIVADSSELSFDYISNMLEGEAQLISKVTTSDELLDLIYRKPNDYSLCLMDADIAISGFGNIEIAIKSNFQNIPVVIMSKHLKFIESLDRTLFSGELIKPFTKADLFKVLKSIKSENFN